MDKSTLGDRMKQYEKSVGPFVVQRMPTIIRIDGKAFHSWTKCLPSSDGPSSLMHWLMVDTAIDLCEEIQTAVFAYTQSDEISVLLRDYDAITTQQWFGGNAQKIASVASALTTARFNHYVTNRSDAFDRTPTPAVFDARVFNIPKEDVTNYFIWRQKDAIRNNINYIARQHFSHKQLHGVNVQRVTDMLFSNGVDIQQYPTWARRGCTIINTNKQQPYGDHSVDDTWIEDAQTPIFTEDRNYIEQLVHI